MIKKELIKEAMEYLKNDCSYAAIVGTIEFGDIDPNVFKKNMWKNKHLTTFIWLLTLWVIWKIIIQDNV